MPQRIYTATLRLSFATKNENKKRLRRGVCWKPPGARGRRVWFRSRSCLGLGCWTCGKVWRRLSVRFLAISSDLAALSLCQGCLESVRIEVPTVCWRARVLPPRVRERTGVDGIEADRVDQAEHDFHALRIISGNGEADSIGAASRDPARAKAAGGNVVERIVGISRGCGCGSGGVGLQNAVCGNRRIGMSRARRK